MSFAPLPPCLAVPRATKPADAVAMDDLVCRSPALRLTPQSSQSASLAQRRPRERFTRLPRSAQPSARIEKSTPLRSSLSRNAPPRSSSSMSAYRNKPTLSRPLSWHSTPHATHQNLQTSTMAHNQYEHAALPADFYNAQPVQGYSSDAAYMHTAGYPHSHVQYQQQTSDYHMYESADDILAGQVYSHTPQWIDPALQQYSWTTMPYCDQGPGSTHNQAQYYHPHHPQDLYDDRAVPAAKLNTHVQPPVASKTNPSKLPQDKVLVGLGLYDRDTAAPSHQVHSSTLFSSAFDPPSPGKGLKLEESWQPSEQADADDSSEPPSSPVPELDSSPADEYYSSFDAEPEDFEDANDFVYGHHTHAQQTASEPYYTQQFANMHLQPLLGHDLYYGAYASADVAGQMKPASEVNMGQFGGASTWNGASAGWAM